MIFIRINRTANVHIVDVTMFYAALGGGVRTYLSAKADWLASRTQIRHTVVAPRCRNPGGKAKVVGIPGLPLPHANGYRVPVSTRIAAHALSRLRPDLIEVGDPYQSAWAALRAGRKLDIPVAAYYHSDLQQIMAHRFGSVARRAAAKYASKLYRQFDLVLAPSRAMTQRLHELGVEHVQHQPLGVDTTMYSPARRNADLRKQLGLPDDARLMIFAGRLTKEKKLGVLLDALRILDHSHYLLLVGSGASLPPQPRVIQMPFERDPLRLASLLASCDMLVHPGDQETFGLVVLEAMASGIPVLGTQSGGVSELVGDDTGLLVPPGDPGAMADGVLHMYDRNLALLGENARRKVLNEFDWNIVIPQLIGHYGRLLGAHQREELAQRLSYVVE